MIKRLFAIKEINSQLLAVLFRAFTVLYGLMILTLSKPGLQVTVFESIVSIAFLLFLMFQVRKFNYWMSLKVFDIVNLLFDTAWIAYVMFCYEALDIYSFCLSIVPLFGYAIMSKPSYSPYLFVTIPFVVVISLVLRGGFHWKDLVPYLFLSWLVWLGRYRERFQRTTMTISSTIDNFFATRSNYNKPHKIYGILMDELNLSHYLKVQISDIYCFVCGQKHISLYNSSQFVWDYTINFPDFMKEEFWEGNGRYVEKIKLSVNGEDNEYLTGYAISLEKSRYLFLVKFSHQQNSYRKQFIAMVVLMNVFSKLARMFETERNLKVVVEQQMNELAHKVNYVNAAVNSMHYIRNELTPLKNYIAMKAEYEKETDSDRKKLISEFIDQEYKKVASSFKQIVDTATSIYEKADYPFSYMSNEKVKVETLYSEIRRIWDYYELDADHINVKEWYPGEDQGRVLCNREGMMLVLDNWISNIKNHGGNEQTVAVSNREGEFVIEFKNTYKKSEQTDFVKSYYDDKKQEINKNRWVGLGIIKDCLEQMEIASELSKDDAWIYFTITMKKWRQYEKESSDN